MAAAATAKAAEDMVAALDEETLALMEISSAATAAPVAVGAEWETFKENVRPLKRGRDVAKLNHALKAHADPAQRAALLEARKKMIEAIDEYQGEDPLQPWLDCIKWVQESFPTGGECSGLVVLYEQCVRTLWHDGRYKDDLRFLKVWLEYAGNCADAEVIYRFLEANQIGHGYAIYYMAYASLMESKNKLRKANEIFDLGIARKAKPLEKLEAVYRTFLRRSTKKREQEPDNTADDDLPKRSFGINLKRDENRNQQAWNSHLGRPRALQRIDANRPLSVYKEERPLPNQSLDGVRSKENSTSWRTLPTQADRNKENSMMPTKWTSHKIPQKLGARGAVQSTRTSSIEVFVEEDTAQEPARPVPKSPKPSVLKLRQATSKSLKKETELLKENPLRNFPLSSLR